MGADDFDEICSKLNGNMMNILIRKIKTAAHMRFQDALALLMSRLYECFRLLCVVAMQSIFSVPRGKKRLIVYLTPGGVLVNGGVMSIYSQASFSRLVVTDAAVVLTTYPQSERIYAINSEFPNNERVWRWAQIVRLARRFDDVVINIPDYYVADFYANLSQKDIEVLQSRKSIGLNVMDQNVVLMPTVKKLDNLRKLTQRITQTCAHTKYASQEFADKFNLPTIWLPAHWCMDCYPEYSFRQKERRIVYSPDAHPRKAEIIEMLRKAFPDFEFYEVNGIPFPRFMDIVARSLFSITFGEGMDGYYSQPLQKHSMSFAVYNKEFFSADIEWGSVWNVFRDYDDLKEHLIEKMKECLLSKETYEQRVNQVRDVIKYVKETDVERGKMFIDRLRRFHAGDFDYYPGMSDD